MEQKNTNMATRYEHEIPEGYEARIEGGKVIIELKESKDERIRKELVEFLDEVWHLGKDTNFDRWGKADCADWMAYLEKQKEQKPTGKINGEPISTENQTTNVGDDETETQKADREEVFAHPKEYDLEKLYSVYGFKIGDKVRLRDGDGRTHVIKAFEEIEGIHGPDFYQVEFEDNSARGSIYPYPGEEYPNGYYTQMEKFEEEQQPTNLEKSNEHPEWDEEDEQNLNVCLSYIKDETLRQWLKDAIHAGYNKPECIEFENEFKNQVSHLLASVLNKEWEYNKGFVEYAAQQLLGYAKHEIKPAEWSEEDEHCIELLDTIIDSSALIPKNRIKCHTFLKSLHPHWKPSEEQMKALKRAVDMMIMQYPGREIVLQSLYNELKNYKVRNLQK